MPQIAQYGPYYLSLNVFTDPKGSNLYFLFSTFNYLKVNLLDNTQAKLFTKYIIHICFSIFKHHGTLIISIY